MFIGMVSPPIPKAKDQPQKQAVKTEAARRVTQTMHENEYQQALETVKEKIRENEGQDMKEKMQDQIRQWFIEVRYLTFTLLLPLRVVCSTAFRRLSCCRVSET